LAEIGSLRPSPRTVVADYADDLSKALASLDGVAVNMLLARLETALRAGRGVFICGNGGSAATATHLAHDLTSAMFDMGHRPCRVVAMSDSPVQVTAIANDVAFEEVFARHLAASAQPGDLLLVLSVSGESPNLLAAARYARGHGIDVLSLVGQPSSLALLSDLAVLAGAADYGVTEDIQLSIGHMAVRQLRGVRRFTCRPSPHFTASRLQVLERTA